MSETGLRQVGTQALLTVFALVLVVFVGVAAILVYQNFELSRRIDSIIDSQSQIEAQVHELQKEVERLNSVFAPETIKKMSFNLQSFNQLHPTTANYYAALVYINSVRKGLDPYLVYSVIQTESYFIPKAVSCKGARGLMQVMPTWTGMFGITVDDLFHPAVNIDVGTWILRDELNRRRDLRRALAAYNSGKPYGGETYVQRVMDFYKML